MARTRSRELFTVTVVGLAPQRKTVEQFTKAVVDGRALRGYEFLAPPPKEDKETGDWRFALTAAFLEEAP